MQKLLGVGGATILGAALGGPGTLLVAITPKSFPVPFFVAGRPSAAPSRHLQHPRLAAPGDHARANAGPDELRHALPGVGADPARGADRRRDRHDFGLTTLFVGAGVSPPIRSSSPDPEAHEMPDPEVSLAIVDGEAGLAPTVTSGFDESGAIAGAGAAAAIDES